MEKKKSPDKDARYVFLSSTQSALSRTPTSGETAVDESAAREVVVERKAKRPKKQDIVVERDDEEDEYR